MAASLVPAVDDKPRFGQQSETGPVKRVRRLHKLPYATNRDGKASSLAAPSSIELMMTMVSKQQSHFQHRQR
jgi:hypothetical protein